MIDCFDGASFLYFVVFVFVACVLVPPQYWGDLGEKILADEGMPYEEWTTEKIREASAAVVSVAKA